MPVKSLTKLYRLAVGVVNDGQGVVSGREEGLPRVEHLQLISLFHQLLAVAAVHVALQVEDKEGGADLLGKIGVKVDPVVVQNGGFARSRGSDDHIVRHGVQKNVVALGKDGLADLLQPRQVAFFDPTAAAHGRFGLAVHADRRLVKPRVALQKKLFNASYVVFHIDLLTK